MVSKGAPFCSFKDQVVLEENEILNQKWAAGTGCNAAPYFRKFNPLTQLKTYDKDQKYVGKWIPELHTPEYSPPIVNHQFARQRAY